MFNQEESDKKWKKLLEEHGVELSMGHIELIWGALSWVEVNSKLFEGLQGPALAEGSSISLAMILLDNNVGLQKVFEPELRQLVVQQLESELY